MCGRCAALAGGKPTTGQRWPEGRRAALFCRRLRRMVVVGHLHFIWFASGCSRRPCWAASDGSRRGENDRHGLPLVLWLFHLAWCKGLPRECPEARFLREVLGSSPGTSSNGGTIAPITAAAAAAALMPGRLVRHACMPCSVCVRACVWGWRTGATVGCCGRIARSAERQQRARAAATRLIASAAHVCAIAMLSVRMPVHGVGESDRPSRVYSDMKCIFCEYLRPFAAREEHAIARARDGKARGFMVSQGPSL